MPHDEGKYSPETFKVLLKKLVQQPEEFTPENCAECFEHLCAEAAAEAQASPALHRTGASFTDAPQAGAFLTALTLSGLEASPEIVAACASVLRRHALLVADLEKDTFLSAGEALPEGQWDYRPTDSEGDGYTGCVDIVGTGGDGHDTFNVSTSAAIVVAGAGVRVAKHGSKAATSSSGSADILMSLGCRLAFPVERIHAFLPRSPFLFLFAPHYHPALAHIAPIRRSLNFRTIFNVLGPLINPAKPGRMLLGVAKKELGETFVEVLKLLNVDRALVVCGKEGLDEISPAGESWIWRLQDGQITHSTIHPTEDFGLPLHPLSSVRGSTPSLNSTALTALLSSSPPPPHLSAPASPDSPSMDAIRDYVLLNAAALLHLSGRAKDWKDGVAIARESLKSGSALRAFEAFRDTSKLAMGEALVKPEDDGGVAAKDGEVKSWLHLKDGHVDVGGK